jgi:gentisate 1,2-dioxygenase
MESSTSNSAISNRLKVVSSDDLSNLHEMKIIRERVQNSKGDVVMEVEDDSTTTTHDNANANDDQMKKLTRDARIYEYGSAANPDMKPIPVLVHPASLHESGNTRVLPFDVSKALDINIDIDTPDGNGDGDRGGPCTSPNLMASFIRIQVGDTIATHVPHATSQAFYVIRGTGTTTFREDHEHDHHEAEAEAETVIPWSTGDMFCVPLQHTEMVHMCTSANSNEYGGAALYWIHDEPLMKYLGVAPIVKKFEPTLYTRRDMLARVQEIQHSTGNCHTNTNTNTNTNTHSGSTPQSHTKSKNRLGVLLGNAKCAQTKTLTHVLWSLLNSIPADTVQRPHRHNSVALDLCVSAAASGNVYTLMGKEIDAEGFIVDPIRCDWHPGTVFITPPGWWHSHHNESEEVAWVLPVQDAGLYTHQRTLDIRFVDDELKLHSAGRIRGSAFNITNKAYTEMVKIGAKVLDDDTFTTDRYSATGTGTGTDMDCDDQANRRYDNDETSGAMATTTKVTTTATAGPKRIFSAQCSVSSKRLKCTQVGADPLVLRKINNRLTSLEGHVESIFD